MDPGTPLYNIPMRLRLSGPLNIHAVEQALSELVRRHEPLRTSFKGDEEPLQFIHRAEPVRLTLVDLSDVSDERQMQLVRKLFREESERPFNLAAPPLI